MFTESHDPKFPTSKKKGLPTSRIRKGDMKRLNWRPQKNKLSVHYLNIYFIYSIAFHPSFVLYKNQFLLCFRRRWSIKTVVVQPCDIVTSHHPYYTPKGQHIFEIKLFLHCINQQTSSQNGTEHASLENIKYTSTTWSTAVENNLIPHKAHNPQRHHM